MSTTETPAPTWEVTDTAPDGQDPPTLVVTANGRTWSFSLARLRGQDEGVRRASEMTLRLRLITAGVTEELLPRVLADACGDRLPL